MRKQYIYQIDRKISWLIEKIPTGAHQILARLSAATHPTIWAVVLSLAAVISWGADNRQLAIVCFVTVLLLPVEQLLKQVFRRKRPETMYVDNMKFRSYSFPSGHAYASILVFGLLVMYIYSLVDAWLGNVIGSIALILVLAIGASRVYLGAHFPTDVIAGWGVGLVVFTCMILLNAYSLN